MNNIIKNILILTILLIFLLMIKLLPVACLFWQATGIYCPACGMTRAFHSVMSFNLIEAFQYNILSIPLFLFIIITIIILLYEIIFNKWNYIPFILKKISNKHVIIMILFSMLLSMIINNLH